jgi:hypothetical protein
MRILNLYFLNGEVWSVDLRGVNSFSCIWEQLKADQNGYGEGYLNDSININIVI